MITVSRIYKKSRFGAKLHVGSEVVRSRWACRKVYELRRIFHLSADTGYTQIDVLFIALCPTFHSICPYKSLHFSRRPTTHQGYQFSVMALDAFLVHLNIPLSNTCTHIQIRPVSCSQDYTRCGEPCRREACQILLGILLLHSATLFLVRYDTTSHGYLFRSSTRDTLVRVANHLLCGILAGGVRKEILEKINFWIRLQGGLGYTHESERGIKVCKTLHS